jgi:uncharacterized repeat protein (TIGR02543 family)
MTQPLFVTSGLRNTLRKIASVFLMLSMNLTGGVGALFIGTEVAYAADTGYVSPDQTVLNFEVANPDNAWQSNNAHAIFSARTDFAEFGFPDIVIPSGATIDGIEVTLEGALSNPQKTARNLDVKLKNVSQAASTTAKTAIFTSTESIQTLGGPTDLWGKTWIPSDFSDSSFQLSVSALVAENGQNTQLDHVRVRVYFTEAVIDTDADGLADEVDNCPTQSNENQLDSDNDSQGDVCDSTPFPPKALTITTPLDNGSVTSGSEISCGLSGVLCSSNYIHGASVTLVANPNSGYVFSGWTGACTNTTGHCDLVMDADRTVGASFRSAPNSIECPQGEIAVGNSCVPNAPSEPLPAEDQGDTELSCNPEINLLKNGGFESPGISDATLEIIPDTNPELKWLVGWIAEQVSGTLGLEIKNNIEGVAQEGAQFAELDGIHPTKIWQTPDTVIGQEYELSFMHSPRPETVVSDNSMSVLLNESPFLIIASERLSDTQTSWLPYSKKFTADSATTKVEFRDTGSDNGLGNYLDSVALRCVPSDVFENTYEMCTDTLDNDGDSVVDLADDDCVNYRPTILVEKVLINDNGGLSDISDFTYHWSLNGFENDFTVVPDSETHGARELTYQFGGTYNITELDSKGYTSTYSEGCSGEIGVGEYKTCVITNNDHEDVGTSENTPEACMDGIDNDGDDATDTRDSDCRPTLTVVKTVVGGAKNASEFTLHVNVDKCVNVDGFQATVPENMWSEGSYCELMQNEAPNFEFEDITSLFNVFSVKTAIADIAELIAPATFVGNSEGTDVYFEYTKGGVAYSVTEDADSLYIPSFSTDCTGTIGIGEHKTCTVTNTFSGTSGGGSSTFTYWGCTNPQATNYNSLANTDDGSCVVPGSSGTPGANGGSGNASSTGEVLGAATTEPELTLPAGCSAYLHTYMKMGRKNDGEDVKRLQIFLNEQMTAGIPVTGYYGSMTKNWVKKFQKANHASIIQPWLDAGHPEKSLKEGTGVVYKTTKHAINLMKCATLTDTLPALDNDRGF